MRAWHAYLVAIVVFSTLALHANDQNAIPSLIADPESETPVWVAADVGVENGQLNPKLLGWHLDRLRELAQRNGAALKKKGLASSAGLAKPCASSMTQPPAESFDPASSLSDLTRYYGRIILTGRVVAIREGFWYGLPASLLKLEATWMKGGSAGATYFMYPFAQIATDEGPICSKVIGDADPPEAGDRLMVFSSALPFQFDGGSVVIADLRTGVVYQRRDGRARVPESLRPRMAWQRSR